MVNKNKRIGTSFESRFIAKLCRDGNAVKAGRFYASKGITDVWWVSPDGVHHEAQLKFSSKTKPYIHPDEMTRLQGVADSVAGVMKIWLVTKQFRNPIQMRELN